MVQRSHESESWTRCERNPTRTQPAQQRLHKLAGLRSMKVGSRASLRDTKVLASDAVCLL